MYYEPGVSKHGLAYDPFKSCVVPRPIGWISTTSAQGVDNLAPFSQFQNIGFDPPIVMFSANQTTRGTRKDSVVNAEATGAFVWNMATYDLREAVNISSEELSADVDEFECAGLSKIGSRLIRPPRVAQSPVHFECAYLQTVRLPGNGPMGTVDVVFGRVLAIHIDDAVLRDGKLDIARIKPLARLGYYDYTCVETVFSIAPPGTNEALKAGLEGAADKVGQALGA
ncbi:MAG: flavin reductase family protein [Hyphomicrobiales bacterium]|nr:flavin reductase family protein [Hyphomicrobiales bacterium]